jgi:hypothetical protein
MQAVPMEPLHEADRLLAVADDRQVAPQQLVADEAGERSRDRSAAQQDEGQAAACEARHPQAREGVRHLDGEAGRQKEQERRGQRNGDGHHVAQRLACRFEAIEPGEVHQHHADEPDEQHAGLRQRPGPGGEQDIAEIARAEDGHGVGGDEDRGRERCRQRRDETPGRRLPEIHVARSMQHGVVRLVTLHAPASTISGKIQGNNVPRCDRVRKALLDWASSDLSQR